jgi:hypothetical protein
MTSFNLTLFKHLNDRFAWFAGMVGKVATFDLVMIHNAVTNIIRCWVEIHPRQFPEICIGAA